MCSTIRQCAGIVGCSDATRSNPICVHTCQPIDANLLSVLLSNKEKKHMPAYVQLDHLIGAGAGICVRASGIR